MRQLIVCTIMSFDGFYAGPDGEMSVFPGDDPFDQYSVERLQHADTVLLGRSTYEGFRQHWPQVEHDATASPANREYARLINPMRKVVVSDSISEDQVTGWGETQIVRRADAAAQIAELKRQPGKDIVIWGSRTLWQSLLAQGLVDELHVMHGAWTMGEGIPVFDKLSQGTLLATGTRTWDDWGSVMVQYRVRRT